jgi:hypothetical protein
LLIGEQNFFVPPGSIDHERLFGMFLLWRGDRMQP